MTVLLDPSLSVMWYFLHFMGFVEHNLQAEEKQFEDICAIFNLTLRPLYAILLLDYPTDNHSSRLQEGIAYDRDP